MSAILPPPRNPRSEVAGLIRQRQVLLQAKPAATTDVDLYTVNPGYNALVTVFFANQAGATTIRIALRKAGAALGTTQYTAYDMALAANEPGSLGPFLLRETDVITVRSASGDVSFTANGAEQPKDS